MTGTEMEDAALHMNQLATFDLVRTADPTGISGTGPVAEGVQFSDGTVALRWLAPYISEANRERGVRPTTVLHDDVTSVLALHGHNGATTIRWR